MDSDDEQTRDVFAHFGLAMYLAQTLEHGIVNALVILRLPEKDKYTRQDIGGNEKSVSHLFLTYLSSLIQPKKRKFGKKRPCLVVSPDELNGHLSNAGLHQWRGPESFGLFV
jgi:hypothetical protein